HRVAAIFGVTSSPILNAANVASLVNAVRTAAEPHREPCRALVAQLRSRADALGIGPDADRLRTAETAMRLLDDLRTGEDHEVIHLLATVAVPTSAEALGRSIKSAQSVGSRLDRMN